MGQPVPPRSASNQHHKLPCHTQPVPKLASDPRASDTWTSRLGWHCAS